MTEIEEKVKSNTEKSSHKQYKEIISENRDGSEYVSKPRNTRQVHYQREKIKNSTRPSRCALVNLHMLAYEDTGFVHCFRTMPDLLVICGLEEIVFELEFVLENVPKFEQLLSYDTTFSMGDFYVSPLLFMHCCFIQKPIIPALFLIHERKLQDHHQAVFKESRDRMKGKLNQVPIEIDMEQGIKGAIETETTMYIVGCWVAQWHNNRRNAGCIKTAVSLWRGYAVCTLCCETGVSTCTWKICSNNQHPPEWQRITLDLLFKFHYWRWHRQLIWQ